MTLLPSIIFICIGVVMLAFAIFFKKVFDTEKEIKIKEEKTLHDYRHVLTKAHKDAEKILKDASHTSAQLTEETLHTNEIIQRNADETIAQTVAAVTEVYKKDVAALQETIAQETKQMFATVTQTAQNDITKYIASFSQETIDVEANLAKKADDSFVKVAEELEAYKQEQMQRITTNVDAVVVKVSQEILARTITPSEHTQLLIDALEKAKKEGLLRGKTA